MSEVTRRNHYVSQSYLNRFACQEDGPLCVYRTLVSDDRVPLWKQSQPKGIAFHWNLFTRVMSEGETDEIEKWMCQEFESPAEEAIARAIENRPLTPDDWTLLVRYAALHDVRSPRRLLERYEKWQSLDRDSQEWLEDAIAQLQAAFDAGQPPPRPSVPEPDDAPIRVTVTHNPGEAFGQVQAEILSGRALWLHEIRRQLNVTLNALLKHRWTILSPPRGIHWVTSDAPVLRLNYYKKGHYDFKGGWDNPGTEIMFPLSPQHLLYTQVGHPRPPRGTTVDMHVADFIRRAMCEHAHRFVFASTEDPDVHQFRPRIVDAEQFRHEEQQWREWHTVQSDAEREFLQVNEAE